MGWYTRAQEEPQDMSQLMDETMDFVDQLMVEFEELRNYATVVMPKRAMQLARVATDPDTAADFVPAMRAWSNEMAAANSTLTQAAVKNQATKRGLARRWQTLVQVTQEMVSQQGQIAPPAEAEIPKA